MVQEEKNGENKKHETKEVFYKYLKSGRLHPMGAFFRVTRKLNQKLEKKPKTS